MLVENIKEGQWEVFSKVTIIPFVVKKNLGSYIFSFCANFFIVLKDQNLTNKSTVK